MGPSDLSTRVKFQAEGTIRPDRPDFAQGPGVGLPARALFCFCGYASICMDGCLSYGHGTHHSANPAKDAGRKKRERWRTGKIGGQANRGFRRAFVTVAVGHGGKQGAGFRRAQRDRIQERFSGGLFGTRGGTSLPAFLLAGRRALTGGKASSPVCFHFCEIARIRNCYRGRESIPFYGTSKGG
jgi:hypothetical protein